MTLVDSSVWIDYFNGTSTRETDILDRSLGHEPIMTGDLILAEVLQGFRKDRDLRRAKAALETLRVESMVGHGIALTSASNNRSLRARGVTVREPIAVIIATFCVTNGHQLLHSDRAFDLMREALGLQVV